MMMNRNKKGIAINLKEKDGINILSQWLKNLMLLLKIIEKEQWINLALATMN